MYFIFALTFVQKNGFGIETTPSTKYVGNWIDGKRNGNGVWKTKHETFEGKTNFELDL